MFGRKKKKGKKKVVKKAKPKVKKVKFEKQEPLLDEIAVLDEKEILTALLETKKGMFGDPQKKLKKDIMKRLKVGEKEAFEKGALLAYSRLKDVEKKLMKLQAQMDKSMAKKQEKEEKTHEKELKKSQKAATKYPMVKIVDKKMQAPTAPGPEITARMSRVERLLDEQKKLDAEAAEKKEKRRPNIVKRAFGAVGRSINGAFAAVGHVIFMVFSTIAAIPIDLGRFIARALSGFMQGIYKRVGKFSPFGWKKKINQLIIYSGIEKTQEEVTGITIVNGSVLAGLIAVIGFFLLGWGIITSVVIALISFGVVWVIAYSMINLMADKRSDEVEGALPDVLQIVSANISAGMTPYNALWVAARKEFGDLADEIKIAQKEVLGGKAFTDALTDMGKRVRSNVLQRTIRLLIQGMRAGGELPHILQGIGTDIRQMRLLQKEMAANTMSYMLFIMFGMLLGAPLLFSVSIQFVDLMNKFQPETLEMDAMSSASASPMMGGMQGFDMMSLGGGACPKDFDGDGIPDKWEYEFRLDPNNGSDAHLVNPATGKTYYDDYQSVAEPMPPSCITSNYLTIFATIALFSISFFGSILIGIIRDGKQSAGLKLMPLLIPGTLGMFWVMNTGMSWFFGSMFVG